MVITLQAWIQARHRRRLASATFTGSALLLFAALGSPPWQPAPYRLEESLPELVEIPDEPAPLPALAPEPARPAFLPQFTLVDETRPGADPDDLFPVDIDRLPPPPAPPPAGPFTGATETPPAVVYRVEPTYPEFLREAGLEGHVDLVLTVGETGRVMAVRVLSPDAPRALVDAAVAAAWRWRFAPARQGGRAVAASTELGFAFRIR